MIASDAGELRHAGGDRDWRIARRDIAKAEARRVVHSEAGRTGSGSHGN